MSSRHEYRLDALVKSALKSGPMRPAPFGLHARIWRRLEIAAMIERERRRFRLAVERAFVLVLVVCGAVAAACWFWNPLDLATDAAPGLLGSLDYVLAYLTTSTTNVIDAGWSGWWLLITPLVVISIPVALRVGWLRPGMRRP